MRIIKLPNGVWVLPAQLRVNQDYEGEWAVIVSSASDKDSQVLPCRNKPEAEELCRQIAEEANQP